MKIVQNHGLEQQNCFRFLFFWPPFYSDFVMLFEFLYKHRSMTIVEKCIFVRRSKKEKRKFRQKLRFTSMKTFFIFFISRSLYEVGSRKATCIVFFFGKSCSTLLCGRPGKCIFSILLSSRNCNRMVLYRQLQKSLPYNALHKF